MDGLGVAARSPGQLEHGTLERLVPQEQRTAPVVERQPLNPPAAHGAVTQEGDSGEIPAFLRRPAPGTAPATNGQAEPRHGMVDAPPPTGGIQAAIAQAFSLNTRRG